MSRCRRVIELILSLGAAAVVLIVPVLLVGGDDDEVGRRDLLEQREGFGRRAGSGAARWPTETVTTLADDGPGSLRAALREGSRWIRFEPGTVGTLRLSSTLMIPDDVIVDGRGAEVVLVANDEMRMREEVSMTVHGVSNVVITNLRLGPGADAVRITGASRDVWLHHLTLTDHDDDVITIAGGPSLAERPDRITVSWSRFDGTDRALLIGTSEDDPRDAPRRVTVHHNVFWRVADRQPLVRFAQVHAYNNWLYAWGDEGSGQGMRAGNGAQLVSEGNIFDDVHQRPALLPEDLGERGRVRSRGDLFAGAATALERLPERVFDPAESYRYELDEPGDELRRRLREDAGWHPRGG